MGGQKKSQKLFGRSESSFLFRIIISSQAQELHVCAEPVGIFGDCRTDSQSQEDKKTELLPNLIRFPSIRYNRLLGGNPAVSSGPALFLGWSYDKAVVAVNVNCCEAKCCHRRCPPTLCKRTDAFYIILGIYLMLNYQGQNKKHKRFKEIDV